MFRIRKMEHRINSNHKRALTLVYKDSHDLTFQDLLAKDNQLLFSKKNVQLLATGIFKSKSGVSPELMNIFHFVGRSYHFTRSYTLERRRDHTVYHGSESFFPCSQVVGYFFSKSTNVHFTQQIEISNFIYIHA